jgi:hypothetical protein
MSKLLRVLTVVALAAMLVPASALAWHDQFPRSTNMITLGESPQPNPAPGVFNSDIAFWRNYVVEGLYDGFRVIDASNPMAPTEIAEVDCGFSQGDITISPDGNVLVRSQDSSALLPGNNQANACQGTTTGATPSNGWEGLQIFDISNKTAPRFVKAVYTDCGSHTHTQYYDRPNNRLIIYVSRGSCTITGTNPYGGESWGPGTPHGGIITAVEVPLANPAAAQVVNRRIPAGNGGCHDVSVYEGLKRLYGACRPNMMLWDITNPVSPRLLHGATVPEVLQAQGPNGGWHSAAMSWNGKLLFAGWEPGGGSDARCQATGATRTDTGPGGAPQAGPVQNDAMKTIFIFRGSDGTLVGRWVLPREQSETENCTIHNYALVPYADRHIMVQGSYQSGSSVIDFTDPTAPRELAWADPQPLSSTQVILGGAWSTHWYNGYMYESDIPRGVAIYDLAERWWENALTLPFLNPQTITARMRCTVRARGASLRARSLRMVHVTVRVNGQALRGVNVILRGAGVRRSLQTNADGEAMTTVRPRRAGRLQITASELNVARCSTSRRVGRAPSASGVAGTAAGGGAGLTGRPT